MNKVTWSIFTQIHNKIYTKLYMFIYAVNTMSRFYILHIINNFSSHEPHN